MRKILESKGQDFCPNEEIFMTFFEKIADHAFQEDCAAQTRLFEAQFDLDKREWRMRNTDDAIYETGRHLESQRTKLYRVNQLTDHTRREKSWLFDDLEMRNKACQEDRARDYQEIEGLRRICCTEAERARQLRTDDLSTQKEERKSTVNQLMVQIRDLHGSNSRFAKQCELFE